LNEKAARAMTSHILDWRDADEQRREDGAERAEYRAAGRAYTPRNGPFESVDEVKQVLGGESISVDLLDSFTVYTHTLVPTESLASEAVKRALAFAEEHRLGQNLSRGVIQKMAIGLRRQEDIHWLHRVKPSNPTHAKPPLHFRAIAQPPRG
jgi:type II secretory pathway component PulK